MFVTKNPALRAAAVIPFAAGLLVAFGAGPAQAADTYDIDIHQTLPLTAAGYQKGECPGIGADKDGWHFVIPGNSTDFVKLTVTFEPGGQQVVTTFGPPSDKHAYVSSAPGAKLVAAKAEVIGGEAKWFNLSHTCPATQTKPPTSKPPTTKPPTSAPPTSKPPTTAPPTSTGSATPSTSATPSGSTSATPSTSATVPAASSGGSTGGGLAETGSDTPAGLIAGTAAALLVGGGGLLVLRHRRGSAG